MPLDEITVCLAARYGGRFASSATFSARHNLIKDWYGTSSRRAWLRIVFRISSGIRMEIVSVEGLSLGNVASLALPQST